jgi:YD repeat-containing protein
LAPHRSASTIVEISIVDCRPVRCFGRRKRFAWQARRPTSTVNPAGLPTTPSYDAVGRVTATSVRDVSGNLLPGPTATYGDGSLTVTKSFTYDDNGTTKTLTSTTTLDGWGRTIQPVSPAQSQVNTTYNNMGRVASISNPFAAGGSPAYWTSYSYDALGRQTTVTLPDGQTVQTTYSGNTVTVTDQVNRKMQRLTDGLGRLVTVNEQDAAGNLTQASNYTYDLLDNLTQVSQGGQLRAFKYDALSRLVYEKIPEQTPTISDGLNTWTEVHLHRLQQSGESPRRPRRDYQLQLRHAAPPDADYLRHQRRAERRADRLRHHLLQHRWHD